MALFVTPEAHVDPRSLNEHIDKLRRGLDDAAQTIGIANILLFGPSGSGKSSLLNAVFGSSLARAGAGRPITQHFHRFHVHGENVAIYDAVGFEHGEAASATFEQHLTAFLEEMSRKPDPADQLHVVWVVVNAGTMRFDEYYIDAATRLLSNLPIIVVLNKVDCIIHDPALISRMHDAIARRVTETAAKMGAPQFALNSFRGIVDVVSDAREARINLNKFTRCPKCGDEENLTVHMRETRITCGRPECNYKLDLNSYGLEQLVQTTIDCMPEQQQRAFVSSQRVSLALKKEEGYRVVAQYALRIGGSLERTQSEMIAQLGAVWGLRGSASAPILAHVLSSISDLLNNVFVFAIVKATVRTMTLTFVGLAMNEAFEQIATLAYQAAFSSNFDPNSKEFQVAVEEACQRIDYKKIFSEISALIKKYGGVGRALTVLATRRPPRQGPQPGLVALPAAAALEERVKTLETQIGQLREQLISRIIEKAVWLNSTGAPTWRRTGRRVLCLDGGGMRGLVLLEILEVLERISGRPVTEGFQMIAGTSTGGLIAVLIGLRKLTVQQTRDIYVKLGVQVFGEKRSIIRHASFYDAERLEDVLKTYCGATTSLQEVPAGVSGTPYVFVVSNLATHVPPTPYLFRNYDVPGISSSYQGTNNSLLWKAARATSAAPVYFDPFVDNSDVFIDGGLGGNNPTALCLAEAKAVWGGLADIDTIVSVGTGNFPPSVNWGYAVRTATHGHKGPQSGIEAYLSKVKSLPGLVAAAKLMIELSTTSQITHNILEALLPEDNHYVRLNPMISEVELDEIDAEKLQLMRLEVLKYFAETPEEFSRLVELCRTLRS